MYNKQYWVVICIKEQNKYYEYMARVHEQTNIWAMFQSIPNLHCAELVSTRKKAAYMVEMRNAQYKRMNQYIFDNPAF